MMKKLFTLLAAAFITANAFAQAPEKMSYQAVIRNSSNTLVANAAVGMRISILQGSAAGVPVYVETQTPTTNTNGLASISIGSGTVVTGTFAAIDWAAGTYFIKTETDPAGGTNYTITANSQLLSVPYALYAKTSGSSVAGPAGPQGPTGATGPQGSTGATGIIEIRPLYTMPATPIPGISNDPIWRFLNNGDPLDANNRAVAIITITSATQRLTGSASAALGLPAGSASQSFDFSLCYQRIDIAGQLVTPLFDVRYPSSRLTSILTIFNASSTKTGLMQGSYIVGFAIRNDGGTVAISQVDYLNGWVMLTQ